MVVTLGNLKQQQQQRLIDLVIAPIKQMHTLFTTEHHAVRNSVYWSFTAVLELYWSFT